MKLTTRQCYLALTVAVLFSWHHIVSGEKKGPGAVKLCGDDFLRTYRHLCMNRYRFRRSILNINDITKNKEFPILQERVAKQFLRRIRMPRGIYTDNAKEECCKESCTKEEVREYPCN